MSKAAIRRAKLVATARHLFTENGFHNTGIAQIARESGVLVGQIYRDFASKEDIVAAIVVGDLEDFLADDPLRRAAMAGDRDAVRQWIAQFVCGKDEKDHRLILDIIAESSRNPRIAQIVTTIQERIHRSIADALEVLAPGPEKQAQRMLLTEVILTISVGVFHRRIERHDRVDPRVIDALNRALSRELDLLAS